MDVLQILQSIAVPVTLIIGFFLKNKAPKLANDLIPYLLFGGNFLLGLATEITPATVATAPAAFVAIGVPSFLTVIWNSMLNAGVNTGSAMLLHALGKSSQRRILG